jgi:HME family heavy-metal exporter
MLNAVIRTALQQRVLTLALALIVLAYGTYTALRLPIEVFPDLNRPRVTILTEAHGMVPEEVEREITLPLERAVAGAAGVIAVRSTSSVGLSIIYAEFDWDMDIFVARQLIEERKSQVEDKLPEGVVARLAPISSITGQILLVGMWSEGNRTPPMEVRTLADWVVKPRLESIPGVAQVTTMGGERMQYQVLVDPNALLSYGVTLHEVETALAESNLNVTGGYIDQGGPQELQIRAMGRLGATPQEVREELEKLVVRRQHDRPVLLSQVATVQTGAQVKRGDATAYVRNSTGEFLGGPAVTLTVNKQPGFDTRAVTHAVIDALENVQGLPADVRIHPELYQQAEFIDRAIENVVEALWHGGLLVVVILFLFLMNFRTTFITLTAIPLSIVTTAVVFYWFGLSINTMTLGGLAVAIGELVDDAIVDVENIFRRLRKNRQRTQPRHPLVIVFQASCEIRNSIVFGTLIVVIVFTPLFFMTGMEGRLFKPLGVAYIVSILSSLLVSLTVTPVLSYWLLGHARLLEQPTESIVLRALKALADMAISTSLRLRVPVLASAALAVAISGYALWRIDRDFLPPFNEGSVQINVVLAPGTSIVRSREVADIVDARLQEIDGITAFVSRTGRAEEDEHAVDANVTEIIATFDPDTDRSRQEILDELRDAMHDIPGIVTAVEQPLAHLISHMLSGVAAQIGIKVYGDDMTMLRNTAEEIKAAISGVEGVADPLVESQVTIPQLQIQLDREQLALHGVTPYHVNEFVETALNGRVVSQVLQDQRHFDLLVRFDELYREDIENLHRITLALPDGGSTPLGSVSTIRRRGGPNTINHEQIRRRIFVQCNTTGQRGLVDVVDDIRQRLKPIEAALPPGYYIQYGGQFERQASAARVIGLMSIASLLAVFLLLYALFRSANFALQVMVAVPMAFIGAVAALVLTGQTLTIAAMVGFVSLSGIAVRNGILLLNHYLHLVHYEGETWSHAMLIRAGKERLAPVLMTALTSGIGLIPLALAAGQPGKEILYPVATVMIGGLLTSTLLEFLVRPALFSLAGLPIAPRVADRSSTDVQLVTVGDEVQ